MKKPSKQFIAGLFLLLLTLLSVTPTVTSAVVLNSSDSVDVNVSLNNQVASFNSTGLDLKDNNLYYFENQCEDNEAVDGIFPNGTLKCTTIIDEAIDTENLSETLAAGNKANQTIDLNDNPIQNVGMLNVSNSSSNTQIASFEETGITFDQPLSIESPGPLSAAGGIDLTDSTSNTINSYSTFYLETSSGNPSDIVLDPTGDVGVQSNLSVIGDIEVGGLEGCTANQFVNGEGNCQADDSGTDDQNLSEVLVNGNTANQSINMSGNNISDINYLNDGGNDLNVGGSLDMGDSDITGVSKLFSINSNIDLANANLETRGNSWVVEDTANSNQPIAKFNEGGKVEVPSGNLVLNNNSLNQAKIVRTQQLETGSGDSNLNIFDRENTAQLAEFIEGGSIRLRNSVNDENALIVNPSGNSNIQIPNGDLTVQSGTAQFNELGTIGDYPTLMFNARYTGSGVEYASDDSAFAIEQDQNNDELQIEYASQGIEGDSVSSSNALVFDTSGNIEVPNGDLDLSNNNITNYWNNNLCGEDRAVKEIHENGTVTCTQQIEFADNVENLSETLAAGNTANQSIDMSQNTIKNIGDSGTDFQSDGSLDVGGLSISGSQPHISHVGPWIVDIDSNDNQDNSEWSVTHDGNTEDLFNVNESGEVTIPNGDLDVSNNNIENIGDLQGADIVNAGNIEEKAVTNPKIDLNSINTTQIQDDEVTSSDIASNSITKTDGQLDSSVAGNGLALNSNELDVGVSSALNRSENQIGVAVGGVDTTQLSDDAVTRAKIAKSGCSTDQVLEWTGSEWTCSEVDSLGQDNQTLAEVLDEGNDANQAIDMQDNNINDINQVNSNGQELEVGADINATGNNVEQVSRVDFESGDSATGTEGGDLCLGDRC